MRIGGYLCVCIHCSFITYSEDKRVAEVLMHQHLFRKHRIFCGDFNRKTCIDNERCRGGWRKHYIIYEIPIETWRALKTNKEFKRKMFFAIHRSFKMRNIDLILEQ